jgi:hypothetical protein
VSREDLRDWIVTAILWAIGMGFTIGIIWREIVQ